MISTKNTKYAFTTGLFFITIFALGLLGTTENSLLHAQEKNSDRATSYPIVVEIETELDKEISEIIFKGITEAYAGQYEKALETFSILEKLAPNHPVGYIYTGVMYYLITHDFRNYEYVEPFTNSMQKTIDVGKKWMQENEEIVPWGRFYTAVAYGIRGLHHVSYREYINAFRDGIRGYGYLKQIYEIVPDFYDALYGIGVYEYWYAKSLGTFIAKAERERAKEEGINKLKLAFRNGTLARTFAGLALVEIYKKEDRKEEGLALIETLKKEFPDFVSVSEMISVFYADADTSEESILILQKFRTKVDTSIYVTPLSYLRVDYLLAQNYLRNGEIQKAREILTNLVSNQGIIDQLANKNTPNYLNKKFKECKTLLAELPPKNY